MIDLRDPGAVADRLDLARASLTPGVPVPVEVRELLVAVADALTDTGPLELGVRPSAWERACAAAVRAIDCLEQTTAERASGMARRCLCTLARRVRKLARATEVAPMAVQGLAIPDRKVMACELISAPKQLRSGRFFFASLRQRGMLLLATDRRVLVLKSERRGGPASVEWEASYAEVADYSSVYRPGGENSPAERRVTLGIGGEGWTLTLRERDGEAFLRVLRRRIPEGDRDRTRRPRRAHARVVRIAAALFAGVWVALALTHGHPGGSSASSSARSAVATVRGGECFDVLADPVRCDSSDVTVEVLRCSQVSADDRSFIKAAAAGVPELKALISTASAQGRCAKLVIGPTATP